MSKVKKSDKEKKSPPVGKKKAAVAKICARESDLLKELSGVMVKSEGLEEFGDGLCRVFSKFLSCDVISICSYDSEEGFVRLLLSYERKGKTVKAVAPEVQMVAADKFVEKVVEKRQTQCSTVKEPVEEKVRVATLTRDVSSFIISPLAVGEDVFGFLTLGLEGDGKYTVVNPSGDVETKPIKVKGADVKGNVQLVLSLRDMAAGKLKEKLEAIKTKLAGLPALCRYRGPSRKLLGHEDFQQPVWR